MSQIESGTTHQYREAATRIKNLERALVVQDSACDIHLMGVAHVGLPSFELLDTLPNADVITLELGRNVVRAALAGEDTRLLQKSPFWKKVLTTLEPHQEGKKIVGVEVNQTPRTALRRFLFHNGIRMLASSFIVLEKTGHNKNALLSRLTEQETDALRTYHYVVTEDEKLIHRIINHTLKIAEKQPTSHFPIALTDDLSFVCGNGNDGESTLSLAIIEPPHPSLQNALESIKRALTDSKLIPKRKLKSNAFNIMMTYLLAPVECTEAREIANAASQHARASKQNKNTTLYTLNHVGGSFHTPVLETIFQDLIPPNAQTTVHSTDFSDLNNHLSWDTFIRDTISFTNRLSTIHVHGFEVTVDAARIGKQVAHAIHHYGKRFAKQYAENQHDLQT